MLKTASLRFYPLDSQLPLEIFAVLHSDFPTARVAVVLHREPDLNDAVEDTSPRVICRGVQDSLAKVEVRRYHHRFPCLVASVDNVVDVLHDVLGGALGTEVFKDEEVWGEDSLKVPGTLLEGGFHQVHDLLDIGHETGEPALDDGVRDAGRMEALARAALPVQDNTYGVKVFDPDEAKRVLEKEVSTFSEIMEALAALRREADRNNVHLQIEDFNNLDNE